MCVLNEVDKPKHNVRCKFSAMVKSLDEGGDPRSSRKLGLSTVKLATL